MALFKPKSSLIFFFFVTIQLGSESALNLMLMRPPTVLAHTFKLEIDL